MSRAFAVLTLVALVAMIGAGSGHRRRLAAVPTGCLANGRRDERRGPVAMTGQTIVPGPDWIYGREVAPIACR